MNRKLISSLTLAVVCVFTNVSMITTANAVGYQEEKPKRPVNLVGPQVGKKVQKAYELYSADDIDGAIALLKEVNAKDGYDKAYVDRFVANMLAAKGDHEAEAIKLLKAAIAPDILNEADHADSLKLVAQLEFQVKSYDDSITHFKQWMDFTGKQDAGTWVRIANAYMELKQFDKMISPADKAIALYAKEDKPNQNPFILKINSYYERKMFKDAVKVLETVVQIFPENKAWWTQLGSFYTLVEDYKNALYIFDMSYKQGFLTKDTEIKTLASLYASNEVPYKAAKLLEKHIDSGLVARDDKSLAQLANAWHASQEILKAAKVYGELAKLTNDARHYRKQGALLLQAEKYSQSVEPLTKALELDNKDKGKIYISLMEAYFYQGKYKDAMAMNKEALEDNSSARTARAWTQYIVDTAQRKNVKI